MLGCYYVLRKVTALKVLHMSWNYSLMCLLERI